MFKSLRGFSLVEIVIALGIVSFAIVAILGMFPVAMQTSKESRQDTHSAFITQLLIGQLKSLPATNTSIPIAIGSIQTNNIPINLALTSQAYVFFDSDGNPVSGAAGTPVGVPPAAAYQATLTVMPNVPAAGLSKVTVDVTFPGSVRRTNSYVTTLRNTVP